MINLLNEHFPKLKATVFESVLLNEFLDEKLEGNVIFLETKKENTVSVFRMLQEQGVPNLMFKPSVKDFCFFRTQSCVVVTDLVSEAPMKKTDVEEICLEKLIVDIYCDQLIRQTYPCERIAAIAKAAQGRYLIDEAKLRRYAKRRGKEQQLLQEC